MTPLTHLFDEIVPAQAMQITAAESSAGRLVLSAPLQPNLNDKGTGFAGSMASLLALAGWGAITLALRQAAIEAAVMIVKSEIDYTAAARGTLYAEAGITREETDRMVRQLNRRGRSRISLEARLHSDGTGCAVMKADYAIILS